MRKTSCKDCIHSGLCKDMHRFGVVDIPYSDDGTTCYHYKPSDIVSEFLHDLEEEFFGERDEFSGEIMFYIYQQEFEELKKKYTEVTENE